MINVFVGTMIAAVALAGGSTPLTNQDRNAKPHPSFPDSDGDGATSPADLLGVWDWRFSRMDKNRDGLLSEAERTDKKTGVVRIISADKDRDGQVSKEEIRAHSAAQFARIDLNKDGKIDLAERNAELARKK